MAVSFGRCVRRLVGGLLGFARWRAILTTIGPEKAAHVLVARRNRAELTGRHEVDVDAVMRGYPPLRSSMTTLWA